MNLTLTVNPQIFEKHSDFRRGVVIATNLNNAGARPELERMLRSAVEKVRRQPIDFASDGPSQAWMRAHVAFGSKPNEFPPSHIAMQKRILKDGNTTISFINPVVAVMNIASLSANTSVGGDDIEQTGRFLELRTATGSETFSPLTKPERCEHPERDEVVYADETGRVMCRRWNWRNAYFSRIREETTTIVMNIDGLGEDSERIVVGARNQVAELLKEFCNASVTTGLLTPPAHVHAC
jgi:DNA/RNA-binding domain of Phe-tRNA-synthetase-like protein